MDNQELMGKYNFCWLCAHPMNDENTLCTNPNCPNNTPIFIPEE